MLDMIEEPEDENRALRERCLSFKLVESQMFSAFDGAWTIRYHSRTKEYDSKLKKEVYNYKTKLTYTVFVKPKVSASLYTFLTSLSLTKAVHLGPSSSNSFGGPPN